MFMRCYPEMLLEFLQADLRRSMNSMCDLEMEG
jgi:hypothetical protein